MARFLGLGYPGGPAIDRIADQGDPTAFAFPRSMPGDGYDFSFSGLKTSVVNTVRKHPEAATDDVAASFRQAVVDVLVARARRAAAEVGATALCLAGGVAANSLLRRRVEEVCADDGIGAFLPSRALCTDNAAMVAAAGWWRLHHGGPSPLTLGADPNLRPGAHGLIRTGPGPARRAQASGVRRPAEVGTRTAGCQAPGIAIISTRNLRVLIRATGGPNT